MENGVIKSVLLLLALALAVQAQGRRGIRTCMCQVGPDLYQQGKMVGRSCYVAGEGYCRSFRPDGLAARMITSRPASSQRRSQQALGRPLPLRRQQQQRFVTSQFSQEDRRRAAETTRRELQKMHEQERRIQASGIGVVRPGTPEAALANEKGGDRRSQQLGRQALAQILYLQSLLG